MRTTNANYKWKFTMNNIV